MEAILHDTPRAATSADPDTTSGIPYPKPASTNVDLWIGARDVLTVQIDRCSDKFEPEAKHCATLNSMIQDLARAAQAVIYHAENDTSTETSFALQPLDGLLSGIILFSQLSEGVRIELERVDAAEAA